MNLNTAISNTISAEGEQNWYYVYSPNAGKLTFNLQTVQNSSIDYDLHVFKLNLNTGMLEDEQISAFGPLVDEQLSTLVSADSYYFICVNSYQGFDTATPYMCWPLSTRPRVMPRRRMTTLRKPQRIRAGSRSIRHWTTRMMLIGWR